MPSLIVGAQSGGVPIVSGNPYSGKFPQFGGVSLRVTTNSSGSAFVAYSGNITMFSGGALTSGGLRDGLELRVGDPAVGIAIPPNGLEGIYATVAATVSGQVRLAWNPY